MSIRAQIYGLPGGDNAAYVLVDTGQRVIRMLFDCGEDVLASFGLGELQAIDVLLFSHLHMDHVAGFDSFFRATYNRRTKPNHIYGPPQTTTIMQHRMQGFLWNLQAGSPVGWDVYDVYPEQVLGARMRLGEAFARAHPLGATPRSGAVIIDMADVVVEAYQLEHLTPSLAYVVREKPRVNIHAERLVELGLQPGSWLQHVKTPRPDEPPTLEIDGRVFALAALRDLLVTVTPGGSVAYCTDFLLDEAAMRVLVPALQGCDTLLCESQYRAADAELAQRNYHVTSVQAAELARQAGVGELVLFHVSDRYRAPERAMLLAEAQAIFARTRFPDSWATERYLAPQNAGEFLEEP